MRLLHKLYAKIFGYFWLPCPVCGKMFGGHEIKSIFTAALIDEDGCAHSVCPDRQCSYEAGIINVMNGHHQAVRYMFNTKSGASIIRIK